MANGNGNNSHVPTLADKQIDLSGFDLIDLDQDEVRRQLKPRADFPETARQSIALHAEFLEELQLDADAFDPDAITAHLEVADELLPYIEWLDRRLEQVRETRLVHLAEAYKHVLRLYHRVQAASEFNPQVGYAFAFLADHFGVGKKHKRSEEDE